MTSANRYELRGSRAGAGRRPANGGGHRRALPASRSGGETRCASSSADLPSIDPEIVEALAASGCTPTSCATCPGGAALVGVLVIVLASNRGVELARRIADADRAGEDEARRADLGEDTKRAVAAAVRASTERARGGA